MDWIYALLVSVVLLFLLSYRLSGGDILAPSVVMCAMFTLSTTVAIMGADAVEIEFGLESFFILFIGILTFVVAEAAFRHLFQRNVTRREKNRQLEELDSKPFQEASIQGWIILVGILFDLFAIVWYIQSMISVAGGIGGTFRAISTKNVVTSWETTLINPVLSQLMKVTEAMGYISGFVLIQRMIARKHDIPQAVGLLALMALGQSPSFLAGSRGNILKFVTALLVYYYILWHQKRGWKWNLSWKLVCIGILCVLVGAPLFYYSLQWMGRSTSSSLMQHVYVYVGYPIYLFDLYVKNPSAPVAFGEESLIGVSTFLSKFLGLDVYVRNPHLEVRYSNGVRLGNVYTFFRRPLHDFGFGGMLVFTCLVALLFSWIYYSKIKWRSRTKGTDCWVLAYGYLFYWIVLTSIDQISQSYVSIATVLNIAIIAVGYHLMTGLKVVTDRDRRYIRYHKTQSQAPIPRQLGHLVR